MLFCFRAWARRGWLALFGPVGDSNSLMMMLSLGPILGLVYCLLIFPFLKRLYVVAFHLGHPNFQYMKYCFLTRFLKWMFRHCLVMFVFVRNNLKSHFLSNPTNLLNLLLLLITMFGGPPRSLLPCGNVGLLPLSMIIPVSIGSFFSSLINMRFHRFSNSSTPPFKPSSTLNSPFYVTIVGST